MVIIIEDLRSASPGFESLIGFIVDIFVLLEPRLSASKWHSVISSDSRIEIY